MEGRNRNEIWHKGSLGVRMMPERRIHAYRAHGAEKARDTALDDEKYDVTETADVQRAKI